MAKPETVQIPLVLEVPRPEYGKLSQEAKAAKSDPAKMLQAWVPYWLEHYLGGGTMLESQHVGHLNELAEKKIGSAQEIVKLVEKALGREDGQHTVKIQIDPAKLPSIKERSAEIGWSIDDLMQNCVEMVLTHPTLMSVLTSMDTVINMEADDMAEMRRLLGKNAFNGKDVLGLIRELKRGPQSKAEAA